MKGQAFIVNENDLSPDVLEDMKSPSQGTVQPIFQEDGRLLLHHISGFLSEHQNQRLYEDVVQKSWIPVGIDGIKSHYTPGDRIGSWRLSCFEPVLAEYFFDRLQQIVPQTVLFDGTSAECDGHALWKMVGVNPLMRFIRYQPQGALVPHYDRSYMEGSRRSLRSLVVYLTPTAPGRGRTRFLKDDQAMLSIEEKDLSDRFYEPKSSDLLFQASMRAGDAIVFDHALLHDGEPLAEGLDKILLRTDVMFERV